MPDGLLKQWYSNGQISAEVELREGLVITGTKWKPNGEICPVSNIVEGNGIWVLYNEDGIETNLKNYKKGKEVPQIPEPVLEEPQPAIFPDK